MAGKIYGYDIEVFPNYASFIFVDVEEYMRVYNEIRTGGKLNVPEHVKIAKINAIPYKAFEISSIDGYEANDILELISFISQDDYLMGFNNGDYDNLMLNFLQCELYKFKSIKDINTKLYKRTKFTIETDREILNRDYKHKLYKFYNARYSSIDVQKIPALDKIFKSLKQTLINISWHSINDFELPPIGVEEGKKYYPDIYPENYHMIQVWDRYLLPEHLNELEVYNVNDVYGTCELFCFLKKQVSLRFDLNDKYGIDTLMASDSKICDIFISRYYSEHTGLAYSEFKDLRTYRSRMNIGKIITPLVKFKTKTLNKLLSDLLNTTVTSTNDIDFPVEFNGVTFDIKSGGLHSRDNPAWFEETLKRLIKDFDWASYYPNLILLLGTAPKHLDKDVLLFIIKIIIEQRLEAKAKGNKVDADSLKITINTFFGKTNFAYSFLFDTIVTLTTTINGQLLLLMLIEQLALEGIPTVSANTDGIVCDIDADKLDTYYRICNDFAEYIGIAGEYTEYVKYFRLDVNNYITVKQVRFDPKKHKEKDLPDFDREDETGKYYLDVKRKGQLNQYLCTEDLKKGFNKPVVAKAVEEYFVNGTPVRDTIMNERNIYLFCVTQNMAKKFTPIHRKVINRKFVDEVIQKNIRFFIAKQGGGVLFKKDGNSLSSVVSGENVTIFNDYYEVEDFNDYGIKYEYYIQAANKLVNIIESGIKPKNKKLLKKQSDRFMNDLFAAETFVNDKITRKEESLLLAREDEIVVVPKTNLQDEPVIESNIGTDQQYDKNFEDKSFESSSWQNEVDDDAFDAMSTDKSKEFIEANTSSFTGDLGDDSGDTEYSFDPDEDDDMPF